MSMKNFSFLPWLKPLIILLIFCHLFGCYTSKQVNKPIDEIMSEKPKLVKVEKTDSSFIELYYGFIQNDSLKGRVLEEQKVGSQTYMVQDSASIALKDINYIEVKDSNSGATLAVILVLPIAVGLCIGIYYLGKYIYLSEHGI